MLLGFVFQSPANLSGEIGKTSVRWYGLIAMAVLSVPPLSSTSPKKERSIPINR